MYINILFIIYNQSSIMKKFLITTLICLLSFIGFSQNGGQFFENNVIRINYVGYSNGQHTFIVCNKQDCEARIRTKADQDSAIDIIVRALDCETVYVSRPTNVNILFRSKAETACITRPDMGWLEINTGLGVLSLNNTPMIIFIRENQKYKVYIDRGFLNFDFGSLIENVNISVFDNNGRLTFSQRNQVKKTLSINTNLFLSNGLNYVKVHIQNKFNDHYLFKIFRN